MAHTLEPVDHDPFKVEELLENPVIQKALKLPMVINRDYCVPYGAGRSNDNKETYVDQHVPEFDKDFIAGPGRGSLWKYVDIHEKTEFAVMTELGMPYQKAHIEVATPLERHFLEKDGGDWKEYEAVWDGYLDETEHEIKGPKPPNLYMGPYSKKATLELEPVSHDPFRGESK